MQLLTKEVVLLTLQVKSLMHRAVYLAMEQLMSI